MIDQQDQDVYDEVSSAYSDVRLERDAEDVIRRGRTLRRRRKTMPALAAAGVLAFSLSVAAVTAHTHRPTSVAVVNVDEAEFSIHTDAQRGVVTLTMRQFMDASVVTKLLAEAGIPAVVYSEHVTPHAIIWPCNWAGASVIDSGKVIVHVKNPTDVVFEINRNAMPRGSVVAFDFLSIIMPNGTMNAASAQLLSAAPTSGTPTSCAAGVSQSTTTWIWTQVHLSSPHASIHQ
jgi:hypothetical protein